MKLDNPQKSYLTTTRRVFLNLLTGGIIGSLLTWFLYPIVRFLMPPRGNSQDPDVVQINAAEIPAGKSKVIDFKNTPTIVINTGQGLVALTAVCTHLGCIVQWDEPSQQIICPCHGARYDLNGNVKSGPAPKPLTLVKSRVVDDKILIGEA
jgi:cytochrome b6-f complex iron-sulfur subunit